MTSLVGIILGNLQISKKHVRCSGLLCLFCTICFATLLYVVDFSFTESVYTMSATASKNYVAPLRFHNGSLPFLSTEPDMSWEKHVTRHSLVILVMSAPANFKRKMVIRHTWASKLPTGVKVFFVVGGKSLMYGTKAKIDTEMIHNKDLIVLPNLVDEYKRLTTKVVSAMKWINNKLTFDYLSKVDDDVFVRVDKLHKKLQLRPTEGLYWGYFKNGSEILKEGKWAEPKQYICEKYVAYALGGGYILSKDLVKYIVDNSDKLKMFVNEDVSVGTWLAPLEVNRVHDEQFSMKRGCKEDYILLHYASILDMKKFNLSLAANNTLCGSQIKAEKTGSIIESSEGNGTLVGNKSTQVKAEKSELIMENSNGYDTLMESKHLQIMGKLIENLPVIKNKNKNELFTKSKPINGK